MQRLEMQEIGDEELEQLIASADSSREADRALAAELGRPRPAGPAATVDYLQQLDRQGALPPEAERQLVAAAQRGDQNARGRLVEAFLPLIAATARVYRDSPSVDRIELIQEGVVGLLRALERYDGERGVPFWGYASFWVRQAMQQVVAELTRPLVLSDRALRQLARIRDAHRSTVQETGREPTSADLAERAGVSAEQVESLLVAERPARSTDETVAGEEGALGTLGELLVDPLAEGEYERVLEAIEAEQLLALLSGLSDREREIVRARAGVDGEGQSLREIGARFGLSAERVRQLEQRALGKLSAGAGLEPAD